MVDIKENVSVLPLNTFGIEARTAWLAEYDSVDQLRETIAYINDNLPHLPLLHIGGGSNLLFTRDFPGILLHSRIKGVEVIAESDDCVELKVGAAVVWDEFVAHCVESGFYGAENLSLIPGEVGASAVQNIGAYGAEAKDLIVRVHLVDLSTGEQRVMDNADCHYAYRQSIFKGALRGRYAVTHVVYKLSRTFTPSIDYGNIRAEFEKRALSLTAVNLRQVIIDVRNSKLPDPKVLGNAGSFFMNPIIARSDYEQLLSRFPDMPHYDVDDVRVKVPAGWLIDQCGWKGRSLGPAGVHDRQALVLVNRGGAKGCDIVALSDAVCKSVKEKFGIEIHPEVNFI